MTDSSDSSILEGEVIRTIVDVEPTNILEDRTQSTESMEYCTDNNRKRIRDGEEGEEEEQQWNIVQKNQRRKTIRRTESSMISQEDITITVTSKDQLPKQFSFAKLMKSENIPDITKVKYINPYKIHVTFTNEKSAESLCSCKSFVDMGWKCQKSWEVGLSYGVIRDIDVNLTEEEIRREISSDTDIITVKRLQSRNQDGWTPSESVRLGFQGSRLPPYIYLFDVRVNTQPYVFPVTQCSRCWRFGHMSKMCPSNKRICPKCSRFHENCETNIYKCVNCSGEHMALSKSCSVYKKEKRIRELMSEFNCTYKRANSMYVPPFSPIIKNETQNKEFLSSQTPVSQTPYSIPCAKSTNETHLDTYGKGLDKEKEENFKKKTNRKKKKKRFYFAENVIADIEVSSSESNMGHTETEEIQEEKAQKTEEEEEEPIVVSFKDLLDKIKLIIFLKNESLHKKLSLIFYTVIEWLKYFIVSSLSKCSIFKVLDNIINNYG